MFISSVTAQPEELADPKNVDRRAKLRIGAQLGVDVSKVNRFLHNYEEMLSACYTASFLSSFVLVTSSFCGSVIFFLGSTHAATNRLCYCPSSRYHLRVVCRYA